MKNQTKIIVVATVILILILGIRSCTKKEATVASKTTEKVKTSVWIQPPLPELDIPYQQFEINPSQSNVLVSKGGAKINIPANAFLDKDGKVVQSKVTVSFREFYNPLDFYLAGIPMNYSENGIEKAFESGGMVEINASTNNTQVFVNKENKIAELKLLVPGKTLIAKKQCKTFEEATDLAAEAIRKQVKKHKGKVV